MKEAKRIKVKVKFTDEILGSSPSDSEIYDTYIASKAPSTTNAEEEVSVIENMETDSKGMTVFPRNDNDEPIMWDYQIKGFLKDACGMLSRVKGSECSKVKAYKKVIDGIIFVAPRQIVIKTDKPIGTCQRPLRASTPQGERVALAISEKIEAGAEMEFELILLEGNYEPMLREIFDYGVLRGMGQWRNSGKGRFEYEFISE